MKKITALLLLLALCFTVLCSCGELDGKSFDFTYAHVKGEIRACGTSYSEKYDDVTVVDYTITASKGKLTVTGEDGTYTGEYKLQKRLKQSELYEINIGAEPGFASLSEKTLDDGTVEYTLVLTIKGYYVNFSSVKAAE